MTKINRNKKLKTETYVDPESDDQFTISDSTQAMLVRLKKSLNDYGVTMDDLLTAIEIYYDNQKEKNPKKKKSPTQFDIVNLLPAHIKELIPESKLKPKKQKKDKSKKAKTDQTKESKPEDSFEPDEIIESENEENIKPKSPSAEATKEEELPQESFAEDESLEQPGEEGGEEKPSEEADNENSSNY